MKNAAFILRFLENRIANIYERPSMYGGTPEGVDLVLHNYHELWAELLDRRQDFEVAAQAVRTKARVGAAMSFAWARRHRKRSFSDAEITEYVVLQWRKI